MTKMNPKEIKTHETFSSLFPIRAEMQEKIQNDMREGTYDFSQPIILASWDGQKEPVCIDGHTRLHAAISAGIEEIPVFTHEFDTEQEAIEKAIKLQQNRRNMTDADILVCVALLDSKRSRGGDRRSTAAESKASSDAIEKSPSKSAKETADLLGISTTKVERTRSVLTQGDPDTLEAVKKGEMSINKACTETRKKRKKNKSATKPADKQLDSSVILSSEPQIVEKERQPVSDAKQSKDVEERTVLISEDYYKSLKELGGSIVEHVERAIRLYLQMPEEAKDQWLNVSQEQEGEEDEYDDGKPDDEEAA